MNNSYRISISPYVSTYGGTEWASKADITVYGEFITFHDTLYGPRATILQAATTKAMALLKEITGHERGNV